MYQINHKGDLLYTENNPINIHFVDVLTFLKIFKQFSASISYSVRSGFQPSFLHSTTIYICHILTHQKEKLLEKIFKNI